jgi:hypothetical protein
MQLIGAVSASCSNASISCKHQRDQRGVILTGRGNWGLLRAWVQTHWRVLSNRVPTSVSVSQILSVIFFLVFTQDDGKSSDRLTAAQASSCDREILRLSHTLAIR